jgi:hypothetical protein
MKRTNRGAPSGKGASSSAGTRGVAPDFEAGLASLKAAAEA